MATTTGMGAGRQPSPALILENIQAYQRTAALRAAIDLDLFTALAEGRDTPAALAERCHSSERGVRILSDFLTVQGLLEKQDGRYRLTPDSAAFLNRHSPAYMGGMMRFIASAEVRGAFENLAATVRLGTTTMPGAGLVDPEDPIWVDFAECMTPMMRPAVEFIASLLGDGRSGPLRVLDIAAGHGLFGIQVAQRNPEAQITAVDWPQVLAVARRNAEAAGVQDRHHALPGDAFQVEFGGGYDAALLTNFLHHFDPPTCVTLLKKVHASLAPSGRTVILEFVPNDDRVSPPFPANFSMMMLGTTPAGDAYTFRELDGMLREAGFVGSEMAAVPQTPQTVVVAQRG